MSRAIIYIGSSYKSTTSDDSVISDDTDNFTVLCERDDQFMTSSNSILIVDIIISEEIKGKALSFGLALLLELAYWFKNSFFTYVQKPDCNKCGLSPAFINSTFKKYDNELCQVEVSFFVFVLI